MGDRQEVKMKTRGVTRKALMHEDQPTVSLRTASLGFFNSKGSGEIVNLGVMNSLKRKSLFNNAV